MPITAAMRERHTVRTYLDKPLADDVVVALTTYVEELNAKHGLAMRLMIGDVSAFNTALKLVLAKGVKNYLILARDKQEELEEALGYASSEFMLFAQELGLNTWWVGGTFSRKNVAALVPNKTMSGIVCVGYGANQGHPHKSKTAEQVSTYEGQASAWFATGVEAALLAPTAMNRQAFTIQGHADKVAISYAPGPFSQADLGIVKHHFELGAGTENFSWA